MRHRYLLAIASWVVFSAAITLLLGNINAASYLQIMREGSTTDGMVVAREPQNHDSVVVRYTVGGIERVARSSFVAKPNSDKRSLAVGDKVIVYFLPRDPQKAVLGDPRHLLANELTAIALAATLFPTLLVIFFLWGTHARPTRLSELRERVTLRGSSR